MNKVKSFVLVLALALPVGIFLFLKFFGKNEFEVRPFYVEEFPLTIHSECRFQLTLPYIIPDSILSRLTGNSSDSLTLISFNPQIRKSLYSDRLLLNSKAHLIKIVLVQGSISEPLVGSAGLESIVVTKTSLANYKNCFLFMNEPNDLILVDHRGRIRGYYQLSSREEFDRLLMEISIILKQY